jgi:hypothetical protein
MNCARAHSIGALRHHDQLRRLTLAGSRHRRSARRSIDLLTPASTRIILISDAPDLMVSGRNVCSVPRLDVATDRVGEARRTAMAHVKSAIETGVSFAL